MKKRVILLGLMALLTALFMTVSVSAAEVASGECGENLTWVLDDAGTLTVTGSGEMGSWDKRDEEWYDWEDKDEVPWYDYRTYIRTVSLPSGLTSISSCAFYDCSALTTINLPGGLESIGDSAFRGCSRLALPPIPGTVTSIGEDAFLGCDRLQSVVIPAGVTEIAAGTFCSCSNLRSVIIPDSVTSIGRSAFYWCDSLTSIDLPDSLESIGYWAFGSCDSLTSIDLPDSVESIGSDAFYWCYSLTSVCLPANLTSIDEGAFRMCCCLSSITIPAGVTFIGDDAFEDCDSLTDIYFCGTEAQWKEIVPDGIGDNIFDDYSDINIHYNSIHITQQPKDVTTTANASAKFTVKANGTGFTYQWQYSADGGKTWKNNTCTKATFTINTPGESRDGYRYRCVVSKNGISAISQPATLTVAPVAIATHPKSAVVAADDTVSFTVSAKGDNLKYQWQFSKDNGLTWLNNSCKTATFTIDKPGKSRDGYLYRCKVYNADGEAFSNPAVLSVTAAKAVTKPAITSQPKKVSVDPDDTVKFTVGAEGGSLKYQWQYKAPGKAWANNTCTKATFTINGPQAWRDGYQYRCKVSNSAGTVISKAVVLTITAAEEELKITSQPVDAEVKAADKVSFSVTATGTGLKYQWQYKAPGKSWVNNSCTKATLTFNPAKLMRDGYRYRCVVTDVDGNILVSAIALLTVN